MRETRAAACVPERNAEFETGTVTIRVVCPMGVFVDPDGNRLLLRHRSVPR